MRGFAAVVLCAACGPDPSLAVEIAQPGQNRITDALRETSVSIYESDGLTCEQVELGDMTTDQLEPLLTARVQLEQGGATSGSFSGVSRLGHKVIVARGLGEKSALLTAGCAELDEIGEGETVRIKTVIAAKVSIAAGDDGGILVTTTEPVTGSLSINDRAVSWRLYAPSGATGDPSRIHEVTRDIWEPKAPTCTKGGEVTVHPVLPSVPGGFALRLRVSWAADPPPLISRFTDLPHVTRDLATTPATVVRPCAIRRTGGTASIVCITGPQVATELRLTGGALVPGATAPLTANTDAPVGVVAVDGDVYAITERGNWQALFGALPVNGVDRDWWCNGACPALTTYDLQIVPACGGTAGFLLGKVGATPATAKLRRMPLRGGAAEELTLGAASVTTAGCITERQLDGQSKQRQAFVVTSPVNAGSASGPAALVFECAARPNSCFIPQLNDGIGFVPEVPARAIVSTFDATGAVLTSVEARPNEATDSNGRDRLIEVARQPAAAPPEQLVAGNFDDDQQLDLLWHFANRATGAAIQIAYAREVGGTPLTGMTTFGSTPIEELLVGDLDGNGIDEVIAVLGPSARSLDVIPMGVPYPPSAPHDDPPCP